MFTSTDRDRLRDRLVSDARADDRITGAALTGSTSVGRDDRWSDIDLAVSVAPDADVAQVMSDWTTRMYADHAALTHLDLRRGATVYRVYLLDSTLQVDIALSPAAEFGATGPAFQLSGGDGGAADRDRVRRRCPGRAARRAARRAGRVTWRANPHADCG